MSHFAMLVIGPNVEAQLQPFHEFECTGIDDEYVIDVDMTEEVHKEFEEHKEDYENVIKFGQDWYGAEFNIEDDGKITFYRKTNPNAKWDWWQVGGRWTGFYKLKATASGVVGRPGLMTPSAKPGYADSIKKGDLDIGGMYVEAMAEANERYDKFEAITKDLDVPESWDHVREVKFKGDIQGARDFYNAQPTIQALRKDNPFENCERYRCGRERYVELAKMACIVPFGFLKDGKWIERGNMGWWGAVADEKDKDQWGREFMKMFEALPDDTQLTIVDCHT